MLNQVSRWSIWQWSKKRVTNSRPVDQSQTANQPNTMCSNQNAIEKASIAYGRKLVTKGNLNRGENQVETSLGINTRNALRTASPPRRELHTLFIMAPRLNIILGHNLLQFTRIYLLVYQYETRRALSNPGIMICLVFSSTKKYQVCFKNIRVH